MIPAARPRSVDHVLFRGSVARAADETGMRPAICSQTVMRMPTPTRPPDQEGLSRARRFVEEWHSHGRVIPTILGAARALHLYPTRLPRGGRALPRVWCAAGNVPLETAREVVESRQERGMTPIAYAHAHGCFPDVHCIGRIVHATEDDIQLLQQHGAGVVPCRRRT